MNGNGIFCRRLDFSTFNRLPRHMLNSYHVKVTYSFMTIMIRRDFFIFILIIERAGGVHPNCLSAVRSCNIVVVVDVFPLMNRFRCAGFFSSRRPKTRIYTQKHLTDRFPPTSPPQIKYQLSYVQQLLLINIILYCNVFLALSLSCHSFFICMYNDRI